MTETVVDGLTRESVEQALNEAFPDEDQSPTFMVGEYSPGKVYVDAEWDDWGDIWDAKTKMHGRLRTGADLKEFIRAVRDQFDL